MRESKVRGPATWFDRVGAWASAACALHCAAMPLLFLLVPALTLSLHSWSDPHHDLAMALLRTVRWEGALVTGVVALAVVRLVLGYRRHGRMIAVWIGVLGMGLLATAAVGGLDQPVALHTLLMMLGGVCLSGAYVVNRRLIASSEGRAP